MPNPTRDAQRAASGLGAGDTMPARKLYTSARYQAALGAAKKLAKLAGTGGGGGGWIYDYRGRTLCQGWASYADRMLDEGFIAKTDDGRYAITEKGQKAIEAAPKLIEAHQVAQLQKKLAEVADEAGVALRELGRMGLCEYSMGVVMEVEFKMKEVTKLSDQLDWRC